MFDDGISSNGHICAVVLKDTNLRDCALERLRSIKISEVSNYEPLHSSPASVDYGCLVSKSKCLISTKISKPVIRLPFYLELTESDFVKISGMLVSVINSVENKK